MKIMIFLFMLLVITTNTCAQQDSPLSMTVQSILSDFSPEALVFTESITPSHLNLTYIRSISSYHHEEFNGETYTGVTFLNGIYRKKGAKFHPVWEGLGIDETGNNNPDGFARCSFDEERDSSAGLFNDCHIRTYYSTFLHPPLTLFCIENRWSPYRRMNTTLYCFDVKTPGHPLIELRLPNIIDILKPDPEHLHVKGIGHAGEYSATYVYHAQTHRYIKGN